MITNRLPPLSAEAAQFVLDPWVQYCAWKKLNTAYRSRWTRDTVAWPRWLDNPEQEVRRVAEAVVNGRLDTLDLKLPLVPFPKEGGKVRHFVRPSLDAEFSTLLLGVLLCPLLEARMWAFSFGGRWYSGMARLPSWNGGDQEWRFRQLPFSLADEQIFTSYRRSYGLFRRVAKWTAQTMLGEEAGADSSGSPSQKPVDYPNTALPYLSLDTGRLAPKGGHKELWHARLDIASAYPCVRRSTLRKRVLSLLSVPVEAVRASHAMLLGGQATIDGSWPYPFRKGDVWDQLETGGLEEFPGKGGSVRSELASRWMDLLDNLTYVDPGRVGTAWEPAWAGDGWPALPQAGKREDGIPTGLIVSSVWFNAYLHSLDDQLVDAMGLKHNGQPVKGAVFRYVDDLVVLGSSRSNAVDIVSAVISWLQEDPSGTNLMPAHDKVQPELLKNALSSEPDGSETNYSPHERIAVKGWEERARKAWHANPCVNQIDLISLGPFVTGLVEQMSDLGNPGMADMWGHGVGPRLAELHRLVRMDIGNREIREDTRLAFAGRRLAGAPLPQRLDQSADGGSRSAVLEIQRSLLLALRAAPWKPTLWNAAARLVVRLLRADQGSVTNAKKLANDWITMLAELTDEELTKRPWGPCTGHNANNDDSGSGPRKLSASFVRAQFFHGLAAVVRDVAASVERDEYKQSRWSPAHWTGPLMDQLDLEKVSKYLPIVAKGALSKFAGPGSGRVRSPWEQSAVNDLLAATKKLAPARFPFARTMLLHELSEARRDAVETLRILRAGHKEGRISSEEVLDLAVRLGVGTRLNKKEVVAGLPKLLDRLNESASPWAWAQRVRLHEFHVALKAEEIQDIALADNVGVSLREVLWSAGPGSHGVTPHNFPAAGLPPDIVIDIVEVALTNRSESAMDLLLLADLTRAVERIRYWQTAEEPGLAPAWINEAVEGLAVLGEGRLPLHPLIRLLHAEGRSSPSLRRLGGANRHPALFAGLAAIAGSERPLDRLFDCFPDPPNLVLLRELRDAYIVDQQYLVALQSAYESTTVPSVIRYKDRVKPPPSLGRVPVGQGSEIDATRRAYVIASAFWEGSEPKNKSEPLDLLTVRMAQLKVSPWAAANPLGGKERLDHRSVVENWPNQPNSREVLQALAQALPFRQSGDNTTPLPRLTILPEVLVPWTATPYLVATCRRFGIGLLAGTYWRPVPPAVRVGWSNKRWFTNEALLVLPVERDAPGYATRVIRVRKPRPAASELGLERALAVKGGVPWQLLRGDRFFLFRHPTWGGFTVGICSDLLDPTPWALLRGHIAHMFFSAFNEDVDLFGVVTRTRAYEDYCNVVLVNHGSEGGSFAWSPRSGHSKEIARFQGADIDVVADIEVPVKRLLDAQEHALERAIVRHEEGWKKKSNPPKEKFKTPPPGYHKRKT
jgi:hypothetical protein